MGQKTVKYNQQGLSRLPNDKPIVYKILTENEGNNYTGVAQRGQVRERLSDHLGKIPGAKVRIEQMGSIREARQKEARIIKRSQPKYNKQGK
jgi:predicted GIY-YIG superfamily endonuclease